MKFLSQVNLFYLNTRSEIAFNAERHPDIIIADNWTDYLINICQVISFL